MAQCVVSLVNLSVWRCSVPRLRARCAFLWDAILILENLLDKALIHPRRRRQRKKLRAKKQAAQAAIEAGAERSFQAQ